MNIRSIIIALVLLSFALGEAYSQDTVFVQTFTFSDITKRRGFYVFPPESGEYRKVLMYHTLKCDEATTQDNFPCGEWDYIAFTNVFEHVNPNTPFYSYNGQNPDTVAISSVPTYNFRQYDYTQIVYDDVVDESTYPVGNGTVPMTEVFQSANSTGKFQMLFTAGELATAGLTAGSIDKLTFDVTELGGMLRHLHIKMKHSVKEELTSADYETAGFQTVYMDHTSTSAPGAHTFALTAPFEWDGTSNIAIEITFTNDEATANYTVLGNNSGFASSVYAMTDDAYLDFKRPDYIEVPVGPLQPISDALTITCWVYGDPDVLPADNRLLSGVNDQNRRMLNIHLPYSDEVVYFDAGQNAPGVSYDRISKQAFPPEYEGKWHHWAFIKDVSTGTMEIYQDGLFWAEGFDRTQTIDKLMQLRIGAPTDNDGRYSGYMDELRIWNAALSPDIISEYMHKDVDPQHPNYSNLLLDYRMDGSSGFDAVNSVGQEVGQLIGPPHRVKRSGDELWKNIAELGIRPNIRFTQGEYDSHLETTTYTDTVENEQVSVFATLPEIDMTKQGITQTPIDTIIGYAANTWSYTYDADGNVLDSSWIVPDTYLVNQYEQNLHQVQNYITPYGIGLDLGPDGFTWVYDVTDYLPILHDTVDIRAGNQQELIDLKFAFIRGTPARDIVDFETIWTAQYNHADIANDNVMQAKDVQLHPEATEYRVKTRTTGHRFGGFQNCAEFCPKYHNLSINGGQQFEWLNWKSCGENPVIDQGGTWIYDRAGWCPGEFSDTYNHEITPYVTPGGIASIDYGMEVTPAGMEGVYQVAVQLVSYAGANFSLDASVEEIIAPNDWEYRNRVNPICGQPRIVIKNNGTTTLTSLEVTCNVVGGSEFTTTWEGNLEYLESKEITIQLPSMDFWTTPDPANVFEVRVSSPNGGADEYDGNNNGMATFDRPDHYTGDIAVFVKANNAGNENSYTIKNMHGDVVLSRNNIASRESYEDLIGLPDGCYCLEFLDSDEDGLEFFANNDGNGRLYIVRPNNGPVLKTFNSNFGSFVRYCFTLEGATNDISIPEVPRTIDVAPNPGSGLFHVTLTGFANLPITVKVSDVTGRVIYSQEMIPAQESVDHFIDLSSESSGLYFLKVAAPDRTTVERIIKK